MEFISVATNLILWAVTNGSTLCVAATATNTFGPDIHVGNDHYLCDPKEVVRIETNVTESSERDIARYEPVPCPDGMPGCLVFHSKPVYGAEKARLKVTDVKRILTLSFTWNNKPYKLQQEELLSSSTQRLVRVESWKEQP